MATKGIGTALLTYMSEEPNRLVTIDELVAEFEGEYDRRQIMSNMANLLQTEAGSTYITRVQQGVWRYEGKPVDNEKSKTLKVITWESVKGTGIVMDTETNEVYRLTKLG